MVHSTSGPAIVFALRQIETMVASEGGSIELVSADERRVVVRYTPGVNEECPECVPTSQQVRQFLEASLKVHAPEVAAVEVV
jgi:Fe-S cluster biogenesis protein NfuA